MKRKSAFFLVLLMVTMIFMQTALALPDDANAGVVRIVTTNGTQYQYGAGFAVGTPGEKVQHFVTSYDLVFDAQGNKATEISILFTDFKEPKSARIVAGDATRKLAVLAILEPSDARKAVNLVENAADQMKSTDKVYAMGFDANLTEAEGNLPSTLSMVNPTSGEYVKSLDNSYSGMGTVLQHSVVIHKGNVGGPLLNENGQVIGINIGAGEGGNQYWAVSSDEIMRFLDDNDVKYAKGGASINVATIAIIAAAAVLVIGAVLLIALRKPAAKGGKNATNGGWVLVGETGELAGKTFALAGEVLIGRAGQIAYPANTANVSGKHCTVKVSGDQVTVTDFSRCGTLIDGRKIAPQTPTAIYDGQRLMLGTAAQTLILRKK